MQEDEAIQHETQTGNAQRRRLIVPPATLAARLCGLAFVVAAVVAIIVPLRWTLAHPHIAGWDQIQYVTIALQDGLTRKLDGLGALRDALFNDYRWMPPGVRFLAMPMLFLHRTSETDFRLYGLVLFVLSLLVLFDAARRIATPAIAAGCVALTAASPVWVRASEEFMSETAMIPATVLVLWCLVRESEPVRARATPVLMGAALGFDMLARFSAAPLVAIVLLMLAADAWRRRSAARLLVTVLVATLVAWPSYAYNGVRYVAYGRFAATWPLDQLPGRGLVYAWHYVRELAWSILGLPVLVVPFGIVLVVLALLRPRHVRDPAASTAALAGRRFVGVGCGIILLSTVLPHIFGHNQNTRYLLGAIPVLSLFLASGSGLRLAFVTGAAAGLQALVILGLMLGGPYARAQSYAIDRTDSMAVSWRLDTVCDFSQAVRAASRLASRPVVKFYGTTGEINHVQIELAFLRAGVLAHVIPADLTHPDLSDPAKTGADMVLVLDAPGEAWDHGFVADPNERLGKVRTQLLHDPGFVRSEARIGGPSDQCNMDVFLARSVRMPPATRSVPPPPA